MVVEVKLMMMVIITAETNNLQCLKLLNQIEFSKLFLYIIECKINNTINRESVGHTKVKDTMELSVKQYQDDLFYDFNQFEGLISKLDIRNEQSAINMMETFVESVIRMVQGKIVLSHDILLLCGGYCHYDCNLITINYVMNLKVL